MKWIAFDDDILKDSTCAKSYWHLNSPEQVMIIKSSPIKHHHDIRKKSLVVLLSAKPIVWKGQNIIYNKLYENLVKEKQMLHTIRNVTPAVNH